MTRICFLCTLLLCMLFVNCQHADELVPSPSPHADDLFVSFRMDEARQREVRAVPGASDENHRQEADYESLYNTVDVVFFDADGRKLTFDGGRSVFHYTAEGYAPTDAEADNWVGRVYERKDQKGWLRGVYVVGVKAEDVRGKTCVVMLNLPKAVRERLLSGVDNEITTLDALRNVEARRMTSADEQLGPLPFPNTEETNSSASGSSSAGDATNTVDYDDDRIQRITMYGETANLQPTTLDNRVEVTVTRTIAKLRLIISFGPRTVFQQMSAFLSLFTINYSLRNFPAVTLLGNNHWREDGKGDSQSTILNPISGTPQSTKFRNGHQYLDYQFYINEYGYLPLSAQQPFIQLHAHLPGNGQGVNRYWRIILPRGIKRNTQYTFFCTILDQGGETSESSTDLQFDHLTVAPWHGGTERIFPAEDYPVDHFHGRPDNSEI